MINPFMIFTGERYYITFFFFYITFDSVSCTLISYLWHLFCNWKFGSFKNLFNLRIVALQNCIGFCHTSTWISHRYMHNSPLFNPSPFPVPPHPSAAAESLQSCPTVCRPIDGSPPGSPVPGILQAGTLEWAAISFSKWRHRHRE